jgi:anthranilate synthase component 1
VHELSFNDFCDRAKSARVVPVWRRRLADSLTPIAALLQLERGEATFSLMESVDQGERWSRYSFLGRRPLATVVVRGSSVDVSGDQGIVELVDSANGALAAAESLFITLASDPDPELPPFVSGMTGYFGYDVVREVERLPNINVDELGVPDAVFTVSGESIVFDHWRQAVYLISHVLIGENENEKSLRLKFDDSQTKLEELNRLLTADFKVELPISAETQDVQAFAREAENHDYQAAITKAREYIRAGDIFQIVLSQRFDLAEQVDAIATYRALRQINPSTHMFYLRYPDVSLVGSSPEPLVEVMNGNVIARPIAGTRWRGRTEEEDRRLAETLLADEKERAEHVMLVDLARNDLGRVCQFGSVKVDELFTVERYSHVMHLSSQVSGELRDDVSVIDVLRATIPAGTLSGAPKVRAMELIDELENSKRGPYGGIAFVADFSGNLETAIILRTMVIDGNGNASVQAGAGIVLDSKPEREDLETRNKAAALIAAAELAKSV